MATTSAKPKYVQLADHLRDLIEVGELKVGDRLPSYAEMYRRFGATPATAQRVCDLLEQERLIERRSGSGIYVKEPPRFLTGNIGFIGHTVGTIPRNPFYAHLMDGVHQALKKERQQLFHLGTLDAWDVAHLNKVDGVLLCSIEDPTPILRQLPANMPRVSAFSLAEGVTCVGVDDYRGARMAMRHLIERGHRRIACLMEEFLSAGQRRFAGYRDALRETGIEPEPEWIRLTSSVFSRDDQPEWKTAQPYREWASRHMDAWLQQGWRETGCTAILVQNEVAAFGVIQTLQKEGIKVPQDVSVIGFDGTELCDLISPCLSAVALPLAEIGAKAVEVLNRQIIGEPSSEQTILLPLTLRPGESIASLPS